mgnify:CR=1 FL=1
MKIAAIQMRSGLDPDANIAALEPMLAEAATAPGGRPHAEQQALAQCDARGADARRCDRPA